jgi:hypothetical protein
MNGLSMGNDSSTRVHYVIGNNFYVTKVYIKHEIVSLRGQGKVDCSSLLKRGMD